MVNHALGTILQLITQLNCRHVCATDAGTLQASCRAFCFSAGWVVDWLGSLSGILSLPALIGPGGKFVDMFALPSLVRAFEEIVVEVLRG